jgi:hypothetical protein
MGAKLFFFLFVISHLKRYVLFVFNATQRDEILSLIVFHANNIQMKNKFLNSIQQQKKMLKLKVF